jgi:inosine-uridine nucleoside N-ribohydrolase
VTVEVLNEMLSRFKNLLSPKQDTLAELKNSHAESEMYRISPRNDAIDEILYHLETEPPQTVNLLMLGPLTNLALALRKDPEKKILSRVNKIIIMGGCIHQPTPGGNITPNAEFNFYADPKAAHIVLTSGTLSSLH